MPFPRALVLSGTQSCSRFDLADNRFSKRLLYFRVECNNRRIALVSATEKILASINLHRQNKYAINTVLIELHCRIKKKTRKKPSKTVLL